MPPINNLVWKPEYHQCVLFWDDPTPLASKKKDTKMSFLDRGLNVNFMTWSPLLAICKNWLVLSGKVSSQINVPKLNVTMLLEAILNGTRINWAEGVYDTLATYVTSCQKKCEFHMTAVFVHVLKFQS
ncbi:hypothetical protein R1flu_019340 [Riccia fluitans]|uniref:Uncharacterized protein n=1 Tax=Riccia fluitans TaxID=41844 RepID=A0ABD1ZID5_9MARC